jgi:hypothetical protein
MPSRTLTVVVPPMLRMRLVAVAGGMITYLPQSAVHSLDLPRAAKNAGVTLAYIFPAAPMTDIGAPLSTIEPVICPDISKPTSTFSLAFGHLYVPLTCTLVAALTVADIAWLASTTVVGTGEAVVALVCVFPVPPPHPDNAAGDNQPLRRALAAVP